MHDAKCWGGLRKDSALARLLELAGACCLSHTGTAQRRRAPTECMQRSFNRLKPGLLMATAA